MWQRGLCRCDNVKNLDGKDSLDYRISLWVYPCGYTLWAQCNHKGLFSMEAEGDFPGGPWLRLCPSTVEGTGSKTGWGTKMLHTTQ